MALYLIGDLQGCSAPLARLLAKIDFSPSRDTLYLLGDLVNRGPDSLGVLRVLAAFGDSVQCLLGNHDLHLLAMWQGARQPGRHDTAQVVLQAPDALVLLDWLRHRSMALHRHGWLMVHAGVLPQWSVAQTVALAGEVEQALRSDMARLKDFMHGMYGNKPVRWHDGLGGADRLRAIVNALTRLRLCTADGTMDFTTKEGADKALPGYMPWFEVPGRASADTPIAFGHWSTLTTNANRSVRLQHNALGLDTGCLWGGCLTAARIGTVAGEFEAFQVDCEAAQDPLAS